MRKLVMLLLFTAAVVTAQAQKYTAIRHFQQDKKAAGKPYSSPEQINASVVIDSKNKRITVGGTQEVVLNVIKTSVVKKNKDLNKIYRFGCKTLNGLQCKVTLIEYKMPVESPYNHQLYLEYTNTVDVYDLRAGKNYKL